MSGHKAVRLSWTGVISRRLERHGLIESVSAEQLPTQVGIMCGAHAQIMSAAEISMGLRVAGITQAHIQDALWKDHSLIKTYGPRGTVHLLPAQDLPMWTGALSAIPPIRSIYARDRLLTPEQTEEVIKAISIVLEDAELTIDELTEAIVSVAGHWAGDPVLDAFQGKWPRWRASMDHAANQGVLCFGPNKGRKVTYTNPRRWLSGFQPMEGQTALANVVKRYLYAYGPATPQQFAQWLSGPRPWAVELFNSLGDEMQQVEVDDTLAWVNAGDVELPSRPPQGVRLLPYFDVYVVGSHPREKIYPGRAAGRALSGGQAGNFPVLLIDGIVAGVWHLRRAGRKIALTVEPLADLSEAQRRKLDDEVNRLGDFLQGDAQLTIGPVTVGRTCLNAKVPS